MSRVTYAKVCSEPLDQDRIYKLVTRGYMGRGKDGYTSLLVKPEGGECDEIVSEENGVLISTIIRQYFLSLRILGKWKLWSKSLERHWSGVNKNLHDTHPVVHHSSEVNEHTDHHAKGTDSPLDESQDAIHDLKQGETEPSQQDNELVIIRRVTKKWYVVVGPTLGNPILILFLQTGSDWRASKERQC